MGAVEISIDQDGALKVVQRYDLRYVNATSSSRASVWGCSRLLGDLSFILSVYIAASYKIQHIKTRSSDNNNNVEFTSRAVPRSEGVTVQQLKSTGFIRRSHTDLCGGFGF